MSLNITEGTQFNLDVVSQITIELTFNSQINGSLIFLDKSEKTVLKKIALEGKKKVILWGNEADTVLSDHCNYFVLLECKKLQTLKLTVKKVGKCKDAIIACTETIRTYNLTLISIARDVLTFDLKPFEYQGSEYIP